MFIVPSLVNLYNILIYWQVEIVVNVKGKSDQSTEVSLAVVKSLVSYSEIEIFKLYEVLFVVLIVYWVLGVTFI